MALEDSRLTLVFDHLNARFPQRMLRLHGMRCRIVFCHVVDRSSCSGEISLSLRDLKLPILSRIIAFR